MSHANFPTPNGNLRVHLRGVQSCEHDWTYDRKLNLYICLKCTRTEEFYTIDR